MLIQEFTASVLAAPPLHIYAAIQKIQQLGINSLHIDMMDDHYVDNLALNYETVIAIADTFPSLNLDIHLMMNQVDQAIDKLKRLQPRMITFHPSTSKNFDQTVAKISDFCLASIAINPDESFDQFIPYFSQVDHCLIMGVQPGRCGQKFQTHVLETLKSIDCYAKKHKLNCALAIDGGVNATTLPSIVQCTVKIDQAVVGNALFANTHYQLNWEKIKPYQKSTLEEVE